MTEEFSMVFFLLSPLLSLLGIAGTVYLIVYLVRNKDKKITLNMRTLLQIYLYLMSFITLILGVVGYSILVNSILSYKFGLPFSYKLESVNEYFGKEATYEYDSYYQEPECYIGEPIEIDGQKVCLEKDRQKKGLINGATFAISMSILFALHRMGISLSEKLSPSLWLKKIYNFGSLLLLGLVGIVVIPVSSYLLLTYIFLRPEEIHMIQPPGIAFSAIVFVIPLWIVFFVNTSRLRKD